MRRQTAHLEKVLHNDAHLPHRFDDVHLPAWLRCTEGEQRLPVTVTVVVAMMPLARWAKMTMLARSAVSIVAVALVIARAVNILK
ncbi:hypothetical protein [Actinoallomurus sp. NPDC050550]|uniref:hypothetical protein n=1 Tax=Actinoallomurus sp. NPDC050550 TaxID=3154937 RepID=UPI00340664ED